MNFFAKPAEGAAAPAATGTTFGAIGAANKTAGFTFGAGTDATKPGSFSFGATSPIPSTSASIFGSTLSTAPTFGSTQATQPTLFGSTPSSTPAQTTGFSFGQQPVGTGFGGFGSPGTQVSTATTQAAVSPFGAKTTAWPSFGAALPTSTMNFGQTVPSTTSAFAAPAPASGFGAAPAANLAAATPRAFPTATSTGFTAPPAANPSFAASPPAATAFATPAAGAATFSAPATTGLSTGFGFGAGATAQKPAVSAPSTLASGFGFGATPSVGLGTTTASLPTFGGFNFSQSPAPSTVASSLSFGNQAAKPALSFGATTITPIPSTAATAPNPPAATTAFPASFGSSPLGQAAQPAPQPAGALSGMWGGATTITAVSAAAPTSTLTFGTPTTIASSGGFAKPPTAPTTTNAPSFGVPNPQLPATTQAGLAFGAFGSTQAQSPASMAPSIVAAFTASTKPPSSTFSTPEVKSTIASGFSLNTTPQTLTIASTQPATTAAPPAFGVLQTQPAPLTNVTTLNDKVTTTSTGIALGSLTAPSASSSALVSAASTAAASIATPAAPFQLTIPSSTTAVTTVGAPATTVASLAPTQPVPATSMNFGQLEDAINKWSLELEEQEKVFINQATQVNAWDKVLIANGEKIVSLNEALQTVRTEQQSLDHELDFILGQQRELEELLVPLEKELGNVVISDPARELTYQLADSLDTQLKQMSEDLKEIIEHLNESNRREDNNDPIVQIGRILNAHMSSLQWIDTSTAEISTKLDTLHNIHNTIKQRNRMSFNFAFK